MAISKSTGQVSTHASTRKGGARAVRVPDGETLVRFAETLKLRTLARATQEEYLRFVRKLAAQHGGDPSALEESQVRAHLVHLKEVQHYSPSSMRTAAAAMRAFFCRHLGRDWPLFDLVRSPSAKTLPMAHGAKNGVRGEKWGQALGVGVLSTYPVAAIFCRRISAITLRFEIGHHACTYQSFLGRTSRDRSSRPPERSQPEIDPPGHCLSSSRDAHHLRIPAQRSCASPTVVSQPRQKPVPKGLTQFFFFQCSTLRFRFGGECRLIAVTVGTEVPLIAGGKDGSREKHEEHKTGGAWGCWQWAVRNWPQKTQKTPKV